MWDGGENCIGDYNEIILSLCRHSLLFIEKRSVGQNMNCLGFF